VSDVLIHHFFAKFQGVGQKIGDTTLTLLSLKITSTHSGKSLPAAIALSKLLTEFGIHHELECCELFYIEFIVHSPPVLFLLRY